ncbi:MAG: type II secretion system F family protein [Armatimonadota bacterium]|nr:MAG: type II secretion system F family protein [Armatimonadota bacterium]
MAVFSYVAKDALGKVHKGSTEAENEQVLVRRLREKGFWVQKVSEERAAPAEGAARPARKGFVIFGRVSGRDLSIFCRQFATMMNAGVSLVRCLAVLEEQTSSLRLREIIRDIQASVEAGETLSRALTKYPGVFTNLFVGLVRAGEVGGVLDETLNRLSTFLEEDQRLKRRIKSAMTYPTLVLVFAVLIVLGLVTFIIPRFMELFEELGVKELPLPTQILVSCSDFMKSKWYIIIIGAVLLWTAFSRYIRTRTGKRQWDWVKLRIPVFGKLNHKVAIARFSRTLGTLLVSGVPILQALETVAGAIDNEIISDAVMAARAAIREGERIGDPLAKSGLFPPMVVQMISIGEETGSLDAMLSKVADFYESEVEATLQSLTAALEPVMIVLLGGIVGFIVISMFLPLIAIINELAGGGGM